jgi:hypothetical protein
LEAGQVRQKISNPVDSHKKTERTLQGSRAKKKEPTSRKPTLISTSTDIIKHFMYTAGLAFNMAPLVSAIAELVSRSPVSNPNTFIGVHCFQ